MFAQNAGEKKTKVRDAERGRVSNAAAKIEAEVLGLGGGEVR